MASDEFNAHALAQEISNVIAHAKPLRTGIPKAGKARASVVGVVTTKGHYVGRQQLADLGVDISESVNRDGSRIHTVRAATSSKTPEQRTSHEITEDDDPFNYSYDRVVNPPWPFHMLSMLLTSNTIHSAAVETKAEDYAYNAYTLTPSAWAQENVPEETLNAAREEIERWLASVVTGTIDDTNRPIEELCRDVAMDFEALGSGVFEIRRDSTGYIAALNHIPMRTLRVTNNAMFKETGARFLQKRFEKYAYFVRFNSPLLYLDKNMQPFNPMEASAEMFPPYESREAHFRWDETFVDFRNADETDNIQYAANELYMIARPPFTKSAIYGTPAGITAYNNMLAQLKIDEYNLQFFANKGVPQYAVVFSNMALGDDTENVPGAIDGTGSDAVEAMTPSDVAQLEQTIETFFRAKLASSDRSVLVLTLTGDATVTFEKLSNEKLEASFAEYEKRNREQIRISHRVPNAALGIEGENSGLGGSRDVAQMRRYRDHIVSPGQRMFENIVNALIRCGLLIPYFNFEFVPMDIEEETVEREFALSELKAGAITIDEYREHIGRDKLPEGRGDILYMPTSATAVTANPDDVAGQLQSAINNEKRFRGLLSGDTSVEELDNLDDEEDDIAQGRSMHIAHEENKARGRKHHAKVNKRRNRSR